MKNSILLLIVINFSCILRAQVYEAGIFLGGSNYIGDIGRTNYIYPNKFAGGLIFKYNWNPRVALRTTYSYLPIEANDLEADTDFKVSRGLQFKNTIHELAIGLEYNFYEYDLSSDDKTWTPYILLEVAAFNYNYVVNEPVPNQFTYDTKNAFAIPFGFGIKSKLMGKLAIAFETKFRYTFNDDLDYTSPTIPRLNVGGTNNDWYVFSGVSLLYTFGRPACYSNGL
ncbi:DUF6089 family protein [Polaribacter gangjinensis]|uniref:DUF6089 domain-containing protein n=1 Tax=Polaribacter gangjinensis TaxID=574710 RepID=A0A2S7WEG2_9FLAO|nr:DUF6089 family protein [Polaribacter gangjinensis]PQJ75806.1 hypothetical protein BTO13_11490 [Polaribacter gangjinensis]